ncbi:unnamed protein product [Hydatigera taeniaeformis]|uniref:F-box domain-containing protein n=1 Tax=Hydatigena taeniaeformis TaxID=6205 RepID=A0A0R3X921_HYDTA|nr:unnamed protein product [Hydatigera taeniaeformis]
MDGSKANYFARTELFAKEVIECSSQYGEDGRTAFVAENLCGPPTIYPNFEDSTRSCAFLNYGSRWESYPGSLKSISGGPLAYSSTDYVDVFFERPLIIVRMKIYETFFPGAIVAIRACYRDQPTGNPVNARGMYWATLWQSVAQDHLSSWLEMDGQSALVSVDPNKSSQYGKARIFVPDLFNIPLVPTDLIRIELDVRRCAYHTQLDAVQVEGYEPISDEETKTRCKKNGKNRILPRKELEWYLSIIEEKNNEKRQALLSLPSPSPVSFYYDAFIVIVIIHTSFLADSHEVLLAIFRYLDLPTLCRISCVCRTFYRLADETLSRLESINLQALWPSTTDSTLSVLSRRLQRSRNTAVYSCERTRGRGTRCEPAPVHYASWSSLTEQGLTHHTTLVCGGSGPPADRVRSSASKGCNNCLENAVLSRLRRLDASWCGNYQAVSFDASSHTNICVFFPSLLITAF